MIVAMDLMRYSYHFQSFHDVAMIPRMAQNAFQVKDCYPDTYDIDYIRNYVYIEIQAQPGGSRVLDVSEKTYWCVEGREWMGLEVAGMIINSDYGSFPHSLLSTSKKNGVATKIPLLSHSLTHLG